MWKTYNIQNSSFSLWFSEFLLIQILSVYFINFQKHILKTKKAILQEFGNVVNLIHGLNYFVLHPWINTLKIWL